MPSASARKKHGRKWEEMGGKGVYVRGDLTGQSRRQGKDCITPEHGLHGTVHCMPDDGDSPARQKEVRLKKSGSHTTKAQQGSRSDAAPIKAHVRTRRSALAALVICHNDVPLVDESAQVS